MPSGKVESGTIGSTGISYGRKEWKVMITSTSNDRIKRIIKYKKSAKERRKEGVFIVEGIRMFVEIPEAVCREVYMTQDFLTHNKSRIPDYLLEKVELVAPHVMESMTEFTPAGSDQCGETTDIYNGRGVHRQTGTGTTDHCAGKSTGSG